MAPIMQLTGHQGDILCGKFHPNGEVCISAGMDRQICRLHIIFILSFEIKIIFLF